MIGLRHFLHPIRSSRSLYRRASMSFYGPVADRRLGKVRRTGRDRCWCGGELGPFQWHASYGVCLQCTAYVNRRPPVREELERLYSLDLFWNVRQKQKGNPTIENRSACYRSDGRLSQWLNLVEKYGPPSGRVIEVGCAPGALLEQLQQRGFDCVGVEVSPDVARWVQETTKVDVRCGFFPGIALPEAGMFLAFDVLEHSAAPDAFMREAARLLPPGGVAIIQTPVNRYDFVPPFGERFDLFDDIEHLFLFTDSALRKLAASCGLEVESLEDNLWLGGEVCVFRKPRA